jgi:hypothetical protein
MMQRWANEEDEENGCFPKHNNDKRNNDNRSNKGQWNYSGSSQKCKLDDLVTAVKHNPCGKKLGNHQDRFEKILHKQCLMHPKSKHTLCQCMSLHKSLNAPLPDQDEKGKDKEDKEGDKSREQGYQYPGNIVNIIFGGDGGFPTKRAQKLTPHEILSVEPSIPQPFRYSEFPSLSPEKMSGLTSPSYENSCLFWT